MNPSRGRCPDSFRGVQRQPEAAGVADPDVVILEIREHRFDTIAVKEIKPPIALCRPFAEGNTDSGCVGRRQFALFKNLLFGAVHFLSGNTFGPELFDGGEQQLADFIHRVVARHLGIGR